MTKRIRVPLDRIIGVAVALVAAWLLT